jgi:uncharacterized protein (DUF2384 family)
VAARDDRRTTGSIPFWETAGPLLERMNLATTEFAASHEAPQTVLAVVEELVRTIGPLTPRDFEGADPYLIEALLTGTVACAGARWLGDSTKQRRDLRLPFERVRQALRDLLAERDVAPDRPSKEIARWLVGVTGLPHHELAGLVAVATRTFQRWLSDSEPTAPSGDDEMRLRTLARTVDQLRWSMTPAGVVRWLQRPHPALAGRAPAELLGEPGGYRELPLLAATTRAMVAG